MMSGLFSAQRDRLRNVCRLLERPAAVFVLCCVLDSAMSACRIDGPSDTSASLSSLNSLEERLSKKDDVRKILSSVIFENMTGCEETIPLPSVHFDTTRFKKVAYLAVNNANFATKLFWKKPPPVAYCSCCPDQTLCPHDYDVHIDKLVMSSRLRVSVESDENIFAVGVCWIAGQLPTARRCDVDCTYVSRRHTLSEKAKGGVRNSVQDKVSIDSEGVRTFLMNSQEEPQFVTGPRCKIAELRKKPFAELNRQMNDQKNELGWERFRLSTSDGYWTSPYFDCSIGNIWMISFMMPIAFGIVRNDTGPPVPTFFGVTGVDIELALVDINQCDSNAKNSVASSAFHSTHLCVSSSTLCEHIPGKGFRTGAYVCKCQRRFFHQNATISKSGFSGEEIEKRVYDLENSTSTKEIAKILEKHYSCEPCHESCDFCTNSEPCEYQPDPALIIVMTTFNLLLLLFAFFLMGFVLTHRKRTAIKSASWPFLVVAILGASLSYGPLLVTPERLLFSFDRRCKIDVVFDELGFALLYGSIFVKMWRIVQLISTTKFHRMLSRHHLDNRALARRLGLIILVTVLYLVAWMVFDPPVVVVNRRSEDDPLKEKACLIGPFNYVITAVQFVFMLWGAYLCACTRKVSADFAESTQLSISIYLFIVITVFARPVEYFLIKPHLDQQLFVASLRTHLSITATLLILFVPKIRLAWRNGRQPSTASSRSTSFYDKPPAILVGRPSQASLVPDNIPNRLHRQLKNQPSVSLFSLHSLTLSQGQASDHSPPDAELPSKVALNRHRSFATSLGSSKARFAASRTQSLSGMSTQSYILYEYREAGRPTASPCESEI